MSQVLVQLSDSATGLLKTWLGTGVGLTFSLGTWTPRWSYFLTWLSLHSTPEVFILATLLDKCTGPTF